MDRLATARCVRKKQRDHGTPAAACRSVRADARRAAGRLGGLRPASRRRAALLSGVRRDRDRGDPARLRAHAAPAPPRARSAAGGPARGCARHPRRHGRRAGDRQRVRGAPRAPHDQHGIQYPRRWWARTRRRASRSGTLDVLLPRRGVHRLGHARRDGASSTSPAGRSPSRRAISRPSRAGTPGVPSGGRGRRRSRAGWRRPGPASAPRRASSRRRCRQS